MYVYIVHFSKTSQLATKYYRNAQQLTEGIHFLTENLGMKLQSFSVFKIVLVYDLT